MGWEQRGNQSYYYRKERVGSQVRSVYVGRGEPAILISRLVEVQREEVRERFEKQRLELARLDQLKREIEGASTLVENMTQASLIAAGFHTHKRQWRKKRRGTGFTRKMENSLDAR